jgi:DNA primase catalytic core
MTNPDGAGEEVPRGLAAVTEAAARFFTARMAASWAPAYLAGRGFGKQAWRRWGIGYAPATWTGLTGHLRSVGFADEQIRAAGMARLSAHGVLVDVFRDRVMFGVRTLDGVAAGFIGRAPPAARVAIPVYLNSPTTPLYHKGSVLFGLYEAHDLLASGQARVVITEGPLDAMAITTAGCGRYVGVAPCGTALTAEQVALLRKALRGAPGVIVAFDGDQAGRKAAVRAYRLLRDGACPQDHACPHDQGPLTVSFPAGQDPAGLLKDHGAPALIRLLHESVRPLADLVVDECVAQFDRWLQFTDGKFSALHAVAPSIAGMPAGQVARQVARTAEHLDLTYAEVTAAVTAALSTGSAGYRCTPCGRRRE